MSLLGRTIEGRYVVERALSEGGMGTVWLGKDVRLHRAVVVKVPKPELLADPRFVARFQREVDALRRLEHPSIIPILDTGTLDGTPYVVMPYLPGGSLSERLSGRPGRRASVGEVVAWLAPIAAALDYLHGHGYVHRDIKPANVLFDAHGRAFLTDFGIALALETATSDQRLTQTASLMPGTPAYMAPEQALKGVLSGAADQYALAVTAFEALTGTLPFRGTTAIEILVKKRTGRWVLGPDTPVPSPSVQALRRAMASEPAKRFGSCGAFLHALEAQAGPLEADHGSHGARARRASAPAWRHLAPAAVLLVVGLSVVAWLALRSGEEPLPPRTPPAAPRSPVPAGPAASPAASPAGSGAQASAPPAAPLRPAVPPAPPPSGVEITLESPTEGQLIADTGLTVEGTVRSARRVDLVYVGSLAVPVREGRFSIDLDVEHREDGESTIEVGTLIGTPLVVRTVLLDRQPPRLEVTVSPLGLPEAYLANERGDRVYLPETSLYRVRVRATDLSLASVGAGWALALGGRPPVAPAPATLEPLTPDATGIAEWTLSRGALRSPTLVVRAIDRAGFVAQRLLTLTVVPRVGLAWDVERTSPRSQGLWRTFLRVHPVPDDASLVLALREGKQAYPVPAGGWLLDLPPTDMARPLSLIGRLRLGGSPAQADLQPPATLVERTAVAGAGSPATPVAPGAPPSAPASGAPRRGRLLLGRQAGLTIALEALPPLTLEARLRCLQPDRPECVLFSEVGPERLRCTLEAKGAGVKLVGLASSDYDADTQPAWPLPPGALAGWMHLALVLEPERTALYLNGQRLGTRLRARLAGGPVPGRLSVCAPQMTTSRAAEPSPWTYELEAVRVTRGQRYAADFTPEPSLTLDDATALLYVPDELDERAFWPQGQLSLPAIPGGFGRLAPVEVGGGPADPPQGTGAYLSGSGWAFWQLREAPRDLTLEARVRRFLPWGQHVILSAPGLELCLEEGVPVVYARVQPDGITHRQQVRLASAAPLATGDAWVRLGVTRAGGELGLYVEGSLVASGSLPEAPQTPAGAFALGLGAISGGPPQYVGEVDDIRVSGRARFKGSFDPRSAIVPDADTLLCIGFESDTSPLEAWAPGTPVQVANTGGVVFLVPAGPRRPPPGIPPGIREPTKPATAPPRNGPPKAPDPKPQRPKSR